MTEQIRPGSSAAAHIADAVDAHDASAVSFVPDGSIAATDVQAAIVEVRDEAGGGSGPFEDHSGTAWKFISPATDLLSTDLSTALRLDDDVARLTGGGAFVFLETGKVLLYSDFGAVLPLLNADPAGGDSEEGQIYFHYDGYQVRIYRNGVWSDLAFSQNAIGTADLAIANTETVVVSKQFAANELTAGMTFMFKAYATRAGTTSASPVIRIRIGTTTLTGNIAATLTPPVNTLAVPNEIEGMVTIRSAGAGGTALGSLKHTVHLAAVTITEALGVSTGTVAVNTTSANQKVELTFISGNAANTYTFRNAAIYRVV